MQHFDEYIQQGEPQKREKGYAWQTAIGLQAVDGLKPSEYLIETARKHSNLHPDKSRHPRQKYLLTVKGLAVYNSNNATT